MLKKISKLHAISRLLLLDKWEVCLYVTSMGSVPSQPCAPLRWAHHFNTIPSILEQCGMVGRWPQPHHIFWEKLGFKTPLKWTLFWNLILTQVWTLIFQLKGIFSWRETAKNCWESDATSVPLPCLFMPENPHSLLKSTTMLLTSSMGLGLFISHTTQREWGIIWGISVHSIYKGDVLFVSSVYI